jgi:sterol 3beta-glucosyltransferase
MKITILTYGSRGDIQPFLPLSLRLMERGHSVKLAGPARFARLVEEYAVDFAPLSGDPEDLSRRLNDAGRNFIRLVRELTNHAVEIGADIWRETQEACQEAELIIHTFTHAVGAHTLAREKNIPDIHVQLFPMFAPTSEYPNITVSRWMPGFLNHVTHRSAAKITWWTSRFGFERVRRRAGLPRRKLYWPFDETAERPPTPILCAWSPIILPPSRDWPAHTHVTGYYHLPLDHASQPDSELHSFLQSGEPPVCISFGSMIHRDARRIYEVAREALKHTANRAVVLSGWGRTKDSSSRDILYLEAAPHDWLLPRCKAVIHHGGAGTSAAGLRAGIPNIVVPFMGDQSFWGERIYSIGVGPRPLPIKSLSVETLAGALAEVEGESLRTRAQHIGEQLRGEDGAGTAIKWIEKYSNNFHRLV